MSSGAIRGRLGRLSEVSVDSIRNYYVQIFYKLFYLDTQIKIVLYNYYELRYYNK